MALNQRVTIRRISVVNPKGEDGAEMNIRFRGDLYDNVEEIVREGAVFPFIQFQTQTAFVELHDFDAGTLDCFFSVVDVKVESLNDLPPQQMLVR